MDESTRTARVEKFITYCKGLGIPDNLAQKLSTQFTGNPVKAVQMVRALPEGREQLEEYIEESGISTAQAENLCKNPATLIPLVTDAWGEEKTHAGGHASV